MGWIFQNPTLVDPDQALPGRDEPVLSNPRPPGLRGAMAYMDAVRELANRGDYLPTPESGAVGVAPVAASQGAKPSESGANDEAEGGADSAHGAHGEQDGAGGQFGSAQPSAQESY